MKKLIGIVCLTLIFSCTGSIIYAENNIKAKNFTYASTKENTLKQNKSNFKIPNDIVIYTSAPFENYGYDKLNPSASDISLKISESIKNKSVKCSYIENNSYLKDKNKMRFDKSYEFSRNMLLVKVENIKSKVLIDVHIGGNSKEFNDGITIFIGKSNMNYKSNKLIADNLSNELNKIHRDNLCKVKLVNGSFNQDLSDSSILITIGNVDTNENQISKNIEGLSLALKNLIKD